MNQRDAVTATAEGHYCSARCARNECPCDLCLGQRRKRDEDAKREAGKPTLTWSPFAALKAPR